MFFLGLRLSDFGEEFKVLLKTAGKHDQVGKVAPSADLTELYFHSA